MFIYTCIIIILAVRYNWTYITIFQLAMISGIASIGYLFMIIFSAPIYAVLIFMGIIFPFLYWLTKMKMGI